MRSESQQPTPATGDEGAAAVEFALLLPLLIVMLFGIFQFGIGFNRQQGIHAAAREGARIGALPGTSVGDIEARVDDALSGVALASYDVDVAGFSSGDRPCAATFAEDTVTVEVTATTQFDIPLWGDITVDLEGQGEFRCER